MSIVNFPPFLALITELTSVVVVGEAETESCSNSNRYPKALALRSRQASRRPHGFQVPCDGRRISHAPGLDRLTWSEPGDGTNGVTIDAIATGDPDRSWIVIDHPFRSFAGGSLSAPREGSQFLDGVGSVIDGLHNNNVARSVTTSKQGE
jgi:hypothetical protein